MVSPELLLLLMNAFVPGRLLRMDFLAPFMRPLNNLLILHVIGFLGFFLYLWLDQRRPRTKFAVHRFWVVAVSTILIITTVAGRELQYRMTLPPPYAWNDGALQSAAAAKLLLRGVNPYDADFTTTDFNSFFVLHPGISYGAITHYAYPPLMILLNVPAVGLNQWLGTRLDIQTLYLVVLLLLVTLLVLATADWNRRTMIVLLTLGNPFVWMYAVAGWNDIVFIAALVGSALALQKKCWIAAGLVFGLALAAKQTAWLTIPLWVYWLWHQTKDQPSDRRQAKRAVLTAAIVAAVIYLPFVLWNGPALYDDIVRYVSGSLPDTYPVSGITFLQFLRTWGFIDSPWARTPTWIFEAAFGLPTLWFVSRWVKKVPTASRWLFASTVLVLVITLFNRFGAENYYNAIITSTIAAYILQGNEIERQPS